MTPTSSTEPATTNTLSHHIDVVIIDTGCANLNSVRFAFERLGAKVLVSACPQQITNAPRVVLPGVGNAVAAMGALTSTGLMPIIQGLTQPVLGICLGMQMLSMLSHETIQEDDTCPCLGLIPTHIHALPQAQLPLPHMGWNTLTPTEHPLFAGIDAGSYVYFVHSYCAPLSEYTLAECDYGGRFSAAIGKGNFMGVQFHPEKSAAVGSRLLGNFLSMTTATLNTHSA